MRPSACQSVLADTSEAVKVSSNWFIAHESVRGVSAIVKADALV